MERHHRVETKIVDKLYGQMLEEDIINNEDYPWEMMIPYNMVEKMKNYTKNRRSVKWKWILLTVNPTKETDLDELVKKTLKCSKKCWIEHAEWCYEWRTADEGLHMHMAIEINTGIKKNPSEMRRECYNTFKNMVGNPQHVNMKFSNQCQFNAYVKGIKNGAEKENAAFDKQNRIEFGLQPTYVK